MLKLKRLLCFAVFSSLVSSFAALKTCAMEGKADEKVEEKVEVQNQENENENGFDMREGEDLKYSIGFFKGEPLDRYVSKFIYSTPDVHGLDKSISWFSYIKGYDATSCANHVLRALLPCTKGYNATSCANYVLRALLRDYIEKNTFWDKKIEYELSSEWIEFFFRSAKVKYKYPKFEHKKGEYIGKLKMSVPDEYKDYAEELNKIIDIYNSDSKKLSEREIEIYNLYMVAREFFIYLNSHRHRFFDQYKDERGDAIVPYLDPHF